MTPDIDSVAAFMREAAEVEVLPRFQQLAEGDIREKAPGDLVTVTVAVVDRAGQPVMQVRADTASPHNWELAYRKAYTARTFRRTSLDWRDRSAGESDTAGQRMLANVVSLAAYDNVAIKISGACTLSHQPFPYPDIWKPLGMVFDAFGFDRCMWGTDWTRAIDLLTYEQGVEAFRVTDQLSDSERSTLMGGALTKIYKWSPDTSG